MADRKISQGAMAIQLGLSQTAVSKRLSGAVPFDVNELTVIAALFGMNTADLLAEVAA